MSTAGERIAQEIWNLQRTEIGETYEPLAPDHVGSSTMPQKQNPFTCEHIMACARLLRPMAFALSSCPSMHERDMAVWGMEWLALPQVFILCGAVTAKLAYLLEGLTVDEDAMLRNLSRTGGLIMAESVMMALARAVGHEDAHRIVTRAAKVTARTGTAFADALRMEPEVAQHFSVDELAEALDPTLHVGLSGLAVDALDFS